MTVDVTWIRHPNTEQKKEISEKLDFLWETRSEMPKTEKQTGKEVTAVFK